MIRSKKIIKAGAAFLMLVFLHGTFFPTVSLALTNGYHQPEYTSFEQIDATDVVNLVTGDFSFNIPILQVPGPEGGFSFPLSYHAGIQLDQEASWVGLGWNINVGAIARSVNGYPDDYDGKNGAIEVNDPGGSGRVANYVLYQQYFENGKSTGGTVGIGSMASFGWGTHPGNLGFSLIGFNLHKGQVTVDPVGLGISVLTIAATALTSGAAGPVAAAIGTSTEAVAAVGIGIETASALYSVYSATNTLINTNGVTNINDWRFEQSNNFAVYKYRWYLHKTTVPQMYGSLYLGNMPANVSSIAFYRDYSNNTIPVSVFQSNELVTPASDMFMKAPVELSSAVNPTHVSYDYYNVMGYGISGNIQPYRVEVGTLSYPLHSGEEAIEFKQNVVPYSSYKVPFRYPADMANIYTHHLGRLYNSSAASGIFSTGQMGIDYSYAIPGSSNLYFTINDLNLLSQRIEGSREGFRGSPTTSYKLAGSKYITWFTNEEINNGAAFNNGEFIDFATGSDRTSFRNTATTAHNIGGFSITRKDGLTYHYALPVYNHRSFIYNWAPSANPDQPIDVPATSKVVDYNSFPTTWLLTAITGPDFIDRGGTNEAANGIVDQNDWGYWVKFDYGKFSSNYMWRFPYTNETFLTQPSGGYMHGVRENYYLDKISTRSHTAIFIKSNRTDAKSSLLEDQYGGTNTPSSSLKLNEIVLLTNDVYNTLGVTPATGGVSGGNSNVQNTDNYSKVFDVSDFNSSKVQYLKENRIRSVIFNYAAPGSSEELARETLNSFNYPVSGKNTDYYTNEYGTGTSTVKKGRLTLKSVSFYGRNDNNNKIIPDYDFTYYDQDVVYRKNNQDGWGMCSGSTAPDRGREWSLKKIITPLGSEIEVVYERDTYSSVSGIANNEIQGQYNYNDEIFQFNANAIVGNLSNMFGPSNSFQVTVSLPPDPVGAIIGGNINSNLQYTYTGVVTAFNATTGEMQFQHNDDFPPIPSNYLSPYLKANIEIPNGYALYGGNLRVSKIIVKDENGNEYKTKYHYSEDGAEFGLSSGVCSREPNSERSFSFYDYYDYPSTPVMYSKVTVINGVGASNSEYNNKSEYFFKTPHYTMVEKKYIDKADKKLDGFAIGYDAYLKMYNFNFIVNTSQIGRIDKTKNYDTKGNLFSETIYNYSDNGSSQYNNMGVRTEGSILSEIRTHSFFPAGPLFIKLFRTTSVYYPSVLRSVSINEQGVTKYVTNKTYDYYNGNILEVEFENSWGDKYRSVVEPAYKNPAYTQMGSKVEDASNKNMLSQTMVNKLYTLKNGVNHIVKANVQTWNKNWVYRNFATDHFEDLPQTADVWRKHKFYVWKSIPDPIDGTVSSSDFVEFDLSSPHSNWQKVNEVTRYNHFSMPIEAFDINNNFASTKIGYNEKYPIAEASNAKYNEYVYSGAEDMVNTNFFGGEVKIGTSTNQYLTSSYAHSGKASLKVSGGGEGFIINPLIEASGFQNNKTYRASVWLQNSNKTYGQLFYKLYDSGNNEIGSGTSDVSQASTVKAGNWYLLSLDIPPNSSAQSLKIGVNNTSTNSSTVVYFDDFRVLPKDASMSSYVYDETTGQVLATIDNENFATRYTYDIAGRIIKVEREIADHSGVAGGFVKVREDAYNFAK